MPRISGEKKEETRNKILSISRNLFMENGYYNTSTNLIAREVGIAEGTIFNYFDTKADLFLSSVSEDYSGDAATVDFPTRASSDVIALIMQYITDRIYRIMTLPKKVLIDLTTVVLGKATLKKDIVEDLIRLDENYIGKLTEYIMCLQKQNLIKNTSAKTLGECVFGIVFMELFIYLNIQAYSIDDTLNGIKEKISVLLAGHLVQKQHTLKQKE